MTITIRPADARGHENHGWLDSFHTFSFAHYYDPNHMGFGPLRVINEDRVAPAKGFGTHGHKDMEIISYVLEGALEHKDSLGNGSVVRPGDVQRMSAGTGIRHSEFNGSKSDPLHFLQIWILPERDGIAPSYEQKNFSTAQKQGRWLLIGSRDGRENSVTVHRDVDLYAAVVSSGETLTQEIKVGRGAWIQVVRGSVALNGKKLQAGDGAAISTAGVLRVEGLGTAEVLLFDMALKSN